MLQKINKNENKISTIFKDYTDDKIKYRDSKVKTYIKNFVPLDALEKKKFSIDIIADIIESTEIYDKVKNCKSLKHQQH